ncbi:MAG: hypothetical protein PHN88_11915 [Ignavibacteria bacterium]|nr:hypothetical protein [Ignavibacteria bacterium]
MKKLITAVIIILSFTQVTFSQLKVGSKGIYAGLGYSLVFFTNTDVTNVYSSFDFRKNSIKSEINPFVGYQPSKNLAFEFSPGFLYSNTGANDGFYYSQSGLSSENYFYYPRNAFLLAIPLNLKVKIFPFAKSSSGAASGLFFSAAGGPMMIREEYDNDVYSDKNMAYPLFFKTVSNTVWTGNFQASFGYSSQSVLAYGFEIGYRFVPLSVDRKYPLISSLAGNMNSVILSIKIGYSF